MSLNPPLHSEPGLVVGKDVSDFGSQVFASLHPNEPSVLRIKGEWNGCTDIT